MFPKDTYTLGDVFQKRGISIPLSDVNTLRRAELTLRRWFELECGDSDGYDSWAIERDPDTDIPYMCVYQHMGESYRTKTSDREKGARKRVAKVCADNGLSCYVQTDPRGGSLYVAKETLTGQNYSSVGVYCNV